MADFTGAVYWFEQWGLTDIWLPFILVFTIVFFVLQKAKILGQDKDERPRKNANVMVALVLALSVVIPHITGRYPPSRDPVMIINSVLPNISLIVVAIIMLLIIVGVFGKELDISKTNMGGWIVIAAILIVLFVFGSAADWWHIPSWLDFIRDPGTQMAVVAILVFAIIIWFVTKDDTKDKNNDESFMEQFKKALK